MITFVLTVMLITSDGPKLVSVTEFKGLSAYTDCTAVANEVTRQLHLAGDFDVDATHRIRCTSPQAR